MLKKLINKEVEFFKKEGELLNKRIDFDRLFLRILILSVTAIAVVSITFLIAWFFNLDYNSTELWMGSLIIYITIGIIFIAPFYWKIAWTFISIFVVGAYIHYIIGWSVIFSFFASMALIIFILLIYLSL